MRNLSSDVKKSIIISLVIFMVLIASGVFFHTRTVNKVRKECNQINKEMSDRIQGATRQVYRAITDIAQGQPITSELIQVESAALSDTTQGLLMDASDIGKVATITIRAGEDIHKSMVSDLLEEQWQETELNCIWLSTNLKQYDYVDIRILYPNGTDYIVASKKSIRNIKLTKNNVFFWFTEDEILKIDSAIVDANLHGAKIYTTRYVDYAIQSPSKVTYQPTSAIIDLLNSDPNVLAKAKENLSKSARADMEQKLQSFKDDVVSQEADEQEKGYNFQLDTNTSATTGSGSENNNGISEAEAAENGVDSVVSSARNDGQEVSGEE